MAEFVIHTPETAPAESRSGLEQAENLFGFIPNQQGIMAESPALLDAYLHLWDLIDRKCGLSRVEQHILFLTASFENDSEYCMAGHSGLAKVAGVDSRHVEAVRLGKALDDPRLEALRRFGRRVVQSRGEIENAHVDEFLDAGFTRRQALDVILVAGFKLLSNYTNRVAKTPLDAIMRPNAWNRIDLNAME